MGDFERGKKLFLSLCSTCHAVDVSGHNRVGPPLHGFFDKRAGTVSNYFYSEALKQQHVIWTRTNLNKFLENPATFVMGTRLPAPVVTNPRDREDLIGYMQRIFA